MVIDFAKIDFTKRPKFILRNLDGNAIGSLKHILRPTGKFCYNDISEISFEYPSQVDGYALDEYDLLTGMRVIDVQGYGQFVLRNPEETDNGIVRIKDCKAYSLEYELTNKNITLEEGTYCFWNPFAPDSSILGIIISEAPSWSIGEISNDLISKYRTFSVDTKNIYDWIKSDLQEVYGCIFEFDTYNRRINVRSVNEVVTAKPVYLSTKNLVKEIEIEENTDDLVTGLDVYGAEGVDIRSVNPMGLNRIYNLDAYMNDKYFSDEMIRKWNLWKSTFESYQQPYYQLIIAQNMQITRYTTEESALAELNGELKALEAKQSTLHQAIAVDSALQSELNSVNAEITAKKKQITQQEGLLTTIQNQINGYATQIKSINAKTAFNTFFTEAELKILDRYLKCGSLTDSSFVSTSTNAYAVDTQTVMGVSAIFNLSNLASLTETPYGNDVTFFIVRGGSIGVSVSKAALNAQIVNGTLQVNADKSFVFSLYLNKGTFNGVEFPSGSIAMTGSLSTSVSSSSTSLQFKTSSATLYLTQDVTEYQQMAIEWELYEYAFEILKKLSSPDYFFSTSVVNFLALEEYIDFAKSLKLGDRAYLEISSGIITPIVTGIEIDFDDLTDFSIDFGNAYKLNDASFKLEDLLDQSISMGNSLDFNKYNYSNFVNSGAKTQVKDFMTSAIDAMKNAIIAGENNELTIDQTGLRMRKYDPATDGYSPKQVWMAHNAIMFTNDNWNSATIGIGEFVDKNLGSIFGIIAPAIVGTILAGTSLVIESEKQDGGVAVFKVDAEGASLHNASFNLYGSTGGRIDMGSKFGIVAGADKNTLFNYDSKGQPTGVRTANNRTATKITDVYSGDTPNASFWLDMDGNAYYRGKLIATSGEIGGFTIASSYLYSGSGTTRVAINGGTSYYSLYAFWAGAENPANAPFWVKKNGDVLMKNATVTGTLVSPRLQGVLTADTGNDWLEGVGIRVGPNNRATKGYNFYVDPGGNVWMQGNLTLASGAIKWDNLASDVQGEVNDAAKAADNAATAANNAANLARQIANGTYTGGTFINKDNVISPNITGGNITGADINGGAFHNLQGNASLELGEGNSPYGDLYLYSYRKSDKSKWEVFRIYDNIGGATMYIYGKRVLSGGSDGIVTPLGTWNFSSATVTGLNLTAKFG